MKKSVLKIVRILVAISILALFPLPLKADVIILNDGKVITGEVLQRNSEGVLVKMDYGTFTYPVSWVKDVRKDERLTAVQSSETNRVPNWGKIISLLTKKEWVHELKQIPATVIDTGVLKDVPYVSFHCNSDGYEINIYGDLDKPAGVEIGAINYLVKSDNAKSNCVNFIASILTTEDDKNFVRALNLKVKDTGKREGVTFEVTLPDEPDAYGGWWLSVYNEDALAKARASGSELLAITQPRVAPKPQPVVETPQPTVTTPESVSPWSSDDISYSRPSIPDYSTGDRVYVRGYYRANGTYVNSYTRSYPHSRR